MAIRRGYITAMVWTSICRIVLAIVFLFSGFVKAVDPLGLFYKLQEYTSVLGLSHYLSNRVLYLSSYILPALEFMFGLFLLMGTWRRLSSTVILLVMLVFTPWTLVLVIWDPIKDCGCFGDAWYISNEISLVKNILLLGMAATIWVRRERTVIGISRKSSWLVTLFGLFYISYIMIYSINHLPILDFRPFAIGKDINIEVQGEVPTYKTTYRFEKGDKIQEFTDETYPDSTWNYLGTNQQLMSQGRTPEIQDLYFIDTATGEDISESILTDTTYTFLLVINRLDRADESRIDKLNDLYDYSISNGYALYALTSSDEEEIGLWRKKTGAQYPILLADETLLKTAIRSNPGLLLLKTGTVVNKWGNEDIPDEVELSTKIEELNITHIDIHAKKRLILKLLFIFILPLLVITLIDRVANFKSKEKMPTDENK